MVPKGGYEEVRFWMFLGVLPVASRAASRLSLFAFIRLWLSVFLSNFLSV